MEKEDKKKLEISLKKLKIIKITNAIIFYLIFIAGIFLIMKYKEPIRFIIKNNFLKNSIDFIIGIIVFWGFFIQAKKNEIIIKLRKSFIESKDINIMYSVYNIFLFIDYEYLIYFNHHIFRIILFSIIMTFVFSIFYLEHLEKKYCPNNNILCLEKFYREIKNLK